MPENGPSRLQDFGRRHTNRRKTGVLADFDQFLCRWPVHPSRVPEIPSCATSASPVLSVAGMQL